MYSKYANMAGFDALQISTDPEVTSLYKEYGLKEFPTLAEIEPVAKSLWRDPTTKLRGMELVLGRRVDVREIEEVDDPTLRHIFHFATGPSQAFDLLLLAKSLDLADAHSPK